ncbi:dihydrodipicolinate synthase family protein [Fictibacillus fluitans]|uniref:Dihydrodipicolinate synthase family protein n=1 Tax=Fictibacillus fluitans TaxID=3058422 RepID=A0ABT8HUA0_9BACL|nr:dihydrodipicolinate synthase family protein [Fictibacillus sp. NE201]MDN4524060.1 dihydrodipicolinate synthase family protein [Fictibacillus sp. NE201]
MSTIYLPAPDGTVFPYQLENKEPLPKPGANAFHSRTAYAAAHVVANPFSQGKGDVIDWESTLNYRRHLWSLGLSVAEAMDTAQRGMGLRWEDAKELISRSVKEAKAVGGGIACGAGTDHLRDNEHYSLQAICEAYEEQATHIEQAGSKVILMASRALAASARSPEDYDDVYGRILNQTEQPVILHWLGDMFDPMLAGYWGSDDLDEAMENCLAIIRKYENKIDGIKISLLDDQKEIKMRRLLPAGVKMYTGDDFNYPSLIEGDEAGYSHALLGIFDGIASVASSALGDLDSGNLADYRKKMDATVPLSRHIFQTPTYCYKTGIVFLAYLNGHQPHFRMVEGAESARSILHLSQLFQLADQANVLSDPELSIERMKPVLQLAGIHQMEAVK